MTKNENYLILSDLDGTLLNSHGELSKKTKNIITKINQLKNVYFCIATGRNWEVTEAIYKELGLKTPVICCNGCLILQPTNKSFGKKEFCFSKQIIQSILKNKVFLKNLVFMVITTTKKVYDLNTSEKIERFLVHTLPTMENDVIYWRLKFSDVKFLNHHLRLIRSFCTNIGIHFWSSGKNHGTFIIEMQVSYINKSFGVNLLAQYYNIPLRNVYVFGDNINDIEMLQTPTNSYALNSGHDIAKIKAKYVTEFDNDNDGVACEIARIFKLKTSQTK